MKVIVRNNNIDRAIQVLRRKVKSEGLMREMQERQFYEKPTDKRRRKKRAAIARARRAEKGVE